MKMCEWPDTFIFENLFGAKGERYDVRRGCDT